MYNAVHLAELSTVALEPIGLKPGATRGEPLESARVLFEDAHVEVGIWECTPGAFPSRRDGYREAVTIITGAGVLRDNDGTVHPIAPGVSLAIPEGWSGEWDITETVRKFYVVTYSEPRS
ncbi:MAG: cupin domain-containing protein [Actinobacteria bacterium]|nr:cupin domain-containing protein [Actinomycetota bacterium]